MALRQQRRDVHIRVDRQIVDLLSRSTYENFPRVLRELVSNSYDADATRVDITIDVQKDEIVVQDNGSGMTPQQFDYFLTIAGTSREPRPSPRFRRKRIGQFGVGFLAAFPFADELEIRTTAENSDTLLVAVIPSKRFVSTREVSKEFSVEEVTQIPIQVVEILDPRQRTRHYTSVTLHGLTELAKSFLVHVPKQSSGRRPKPISSPIEQLKWELQDTLILDFPPGSEVAQKLGQRPTGMEVYLDGTKLYRNEPPGEILDWHGKSGQPSGLRLDGMTIRYVVTSPWEPIVPNELRGLKIRVDNVGIGKRETFDLGVHAGALPRLIWLSGEIHIDEGARSFLALSREGFTNAPAIEALNELFRQVLRNAEKQLTEADTRLKQVERELGIQVRGGGHRPSLMVGPRRELVDKQLTELEQQGFVVERVQDNKQPKVSGNTKDDSHRVGSRSKQAKSELPVEIDRVARKIVVFENHPDFVDMLETSYGVFKLIYGDWNLSEGNEPACKLVEPKTVLVNQKFPLFNDRNNGRLFLRIAITLTVLAGDNIQNKLFAKEILMNLIHEVQKFPN